MGTRSVLVLGSPLHVSSAVLVLERMSCLGGERRDSWRKLYLRDGLRVGD
jgi:hypothetical protein